MVPVSGPPLADGAVAVRAGGIVAVGPAGRVAAEHPDLPERDLGEVVLLPGLVDAHCHLEWSLTGGLAAPGGDFAQWLRAFLPLRLRMGPEDHVAAADLGALSALRAGTTTVVDSGPTGAGAAALTRIGLRGVVHLEVFGDPPPSQAAEAVDRLAERVWALDADAGALVRIGVSPHAPYSCGPHLMRALAEHPDLGRRRAATHLAESAEETRVLASGDGPLAEVLSALGLTHVRSWPPGASGPVAAMAGAGLLREGLIVAHCVQLQAGDAERIAAAGVGVAHCPRSNGLLGCGRAPLEALLGAGARVGLGTDGPASAGPYDVRAEARDCALAAGAAGAPVPTPAELVALATVGGARAIGLDGQVGALRPGLRADLVAIVPPAGAAPGDPCAAALHPDARVLTVVVDGRTLIEDGRVISVSPEEVEARARRARESLVLAS